MPPNGTGTPQHDEGRPPTRKSGLNVTQATATTVARPGDNSGDLLSYVAHFQRRVLVEALRDAMPSTWDRRAAEFEAAMPRPGDYNGRATPAELDARRRRCLAAANACRARSVAVHGLMPMIESNVDLVLAEVAS